MKYADTALAEADPDQEPGNGFFRQNIVALSALFLVVVFVFAAIVPISGAIIGGGSVAVESRVKRIAHPFGGTIAEILVGNGDHVQKGQLLIRLDDKVTGADATYSSLSVEQLLAQRARLEAERLGASSITFPRELTSSTSETARKAMTDEQRLFRLRQTEERQIISQLADEVRSLTAQVDALEKQRQLIEPERQGVKELWDKDLVTINRLNQMERTAVEIDGQIASTKAKISQAQQRSVQLVQSRRVEAGNELARILAVLNQQQVRSVSASDQQNRTEIRAPYAGIIEKLAFGAIGEVIRPAETVMEIVPDAEALVVEAAISPADIDQIRTSQKARILFTSFNRASTPEVGGTVSYVATDRTNNVETRQSYYIARIAIDMADLRRENLALRSGMPAEVHIQTGQRSMLSYMTKPLQDQFARAFRDN